MHQKYLHASTFLVNLSLRLLIICMKMFGVTETFFSDFHGLLANIFLFSRTFTDWPEKDIFMDIHASMNPDL